MDEGMNGEENNIKTEQREVLRTRWFFVAFFLAIFLSVFATYYRVFIARSYVVEVETTCHPETEACFARKVCDTEDSMCGENDTPTGTNYYKIVKKKASAFSEKCASDSLDAPECADLSCRAGEADCTETVCVEGSAPEGETCVGPGVVPEESEEQSTENGGEENQDGGTENSD